jgi:hypothetical protein
MNIVQVTFCPRRLSPKLSIGPTFSRCSHCLHSTILVQKYSPSVLGTPPKRVTRPCVYCSFSFCITPERAVLLDCVLRGEKHQDVADDFGVDRSTVTRTLRKWRTQESLESLPRVGRLKLIQPREERALLRIVRRTPGVRYRQLRKDIVAGSLASPTPTRSRAPSGSTLY